MTVELRYSEKEASKFLLKWKYWLTILLASSVVGSIILSMIEKKFNLKILLISSIFGFLVVILGRITQRIRARKVYDGLVIKVYDDFTVELIRQNQIVSVSPSEFNMFDYVDERIVFAFKKDTLLNESTAILPTKDVTSEVLKELSKKFHARNKI